MLDLSKINAFADDWQKVAKIMKFLYNKEIKLWAQETILATSKGLHFQSPLRFKCVW